MPQPVSQLESALKYTFNNKQLLEEALSHPSLAGDKNYQRLELLGDAALSLMITEELLSLFPDLKEGPLAKHRAALVQGPSLVRIAEELKLYDYVLMSEAEYQNGGNMRPSALEDVFEALIGAIYLDSDLETVRGVVLPLFGDIRVRLKESESTYNPKGQLQERLMGENPDVRIEYREASRSGPPHALIFTIELYIDGHRATSAQGSSKRAAEEQAALMHLEDLDR